jgi:hypothetical protein
MPSPAHLFTRPATVTRRVAAATRDAHGTVEWTTSTVSMLVEVQQTGSAEANERGQVVVNSWRLFAPADAQLDAGDAVTVDGNRFEIDGTPWEVRSPRTGLTTHVEAALRRGA